MTQFQKRILGDAETLKTTKITIVVATPYMDETTLCDRVALIQKQENFKIDTPQNICNSFPEDLYEVKTENIPALIKILKEYETTKIYTYAFGEFVHVVIKKEKRFLKGNFGEIFTRKKI